MWKLYKANAVAIGVKENGSVGATRPMASFSCIARNIKEAMRAIERQRQPDEELVSVERVPWEDTNVLAAFLSSNEHPYWTKARWRAAVRKHETCEAYQTWAMNWHKNQLRVYRSLQGDTSGELEDVFGDDEPVPAPPKKRTVSGNPYNPVYK